MTPVQRDEREELARLLRDNAIAAGGGRSFAAADVILEAGFRRPRTVETVEELRELPRGTVVRSANGHVFDKHRAELWMEADETADQWYSEGLIECFTGPFLVIYEPEEATDE